MLSKGKVREEVGIAGNAIVKYMDDYIDMRRVQKLERNMKAMSN